MDEKILKLKELIKKSNLITVLTGAGISTSSGIDDFKTIYNRTDLPYEPERYLSHDFFYEHPDEFCDFVKTFLYHPDLKPTFAHKYLADLQKRETVRIFTQNVDGLHSKAGSLGVTELHGNLNKWSCEDCCEGKSLDEIMQQGNHCDCGGLYKPHVTLYDENVDRPKFQYAKQCMSCADLVLVIGTRLQVTADMNLLNYCYTSDIVIINDEPIDYEDKATLVFHDKADNVFSQLSESETM